MNQPRLDPGIYVNTFPVELSTEAVQVMTASRSGFPDLRPLRRNISNAGWNVRVCAGRRTVYGYGPDRGCLRSEGFGDEDVCLNEHPQLTCRLIVDGLLDSLVTSGYEIRFGKGRSTVIQVRPFRITAGGKVQVHLGYDLRASYWWDKSEEALAFGLTVDVAWILRDEAGQPLNMHRVAEYNATIQVGQIQGEYLPGGARINTEVARQSLLERVLPFVQAHPEFALPCGGRARLLSTPVRVILGG